MQWLTAKIFKPTLDVHAYTVCGKQIKSCKHELTTLLLLFFGRASPAKDGNDNENRRTQDFEKRRLYSGNLVDEIETEKKYQVWGLRIGEDGKATGWCVLFSGTLKQARNYATLWN